ncbi:hypothetical protein CIPAW_06G004800 [Carya illinoinensis]|uniref:Uncharacterized protein n=1 Tax=Carya illinoinensis TaxID=32201 RepID=A0A8T1Q5W6_CARIL|nr:hypothetical protein CIPAW_06G004800 [Carya illinoinensis]
MGVEVFEAFCGVFVKSGEVEKQGKAACAGGKEIVSWDLEGSADFESGSTENVDNESTDGGRDRDRKEGGLDLRGSEVDVLKNEGFHGGEGGGLERERGVGELMEDDGRGGGGDGGDERGGGAQVDGWRGDEDVDG